MLKITPFKCDIREANSFQYGEYIYVTARVLVAELIVEDTFTVYFYW